MTNKSVQDLADIEACNVITEALASIKEAFVVAKDASPDNSNEQYVVIREQIKTTLSHVETLATQATNILNPPTIPMYVSISTTQEIVDKAELERLRALANGTTANE